MLNLDFIKQLEDPYYLPPREEVLVQTKKWLWDELDKYDRKEGKIWCEIITQELIEMLSSHLSSHIEWNNIIKILEVWAGNGKLAYFLQKNLNQKCADAFDYLAVDYWLDERKNSLPIVQNIYAQDALNAYKPNIIIASWLDFHPYNLLPPEFRSKLDKFVSSPNKWESSLEEKEMCNLYNEKRSGPDITHYRRNTPSVKEYILIWPFSCTWDLEKTYGLHFLSKDPLENPVWLQDWFIKTKLDIPTYNRTNLLFWFGSEKENSEVYSFKRKNI